MGTREALDKWLADSEQVLIDYDGTDGMRCRPVTDDDKAGKVRGVVPVSSILDEATAGWTRMQEAIAGLSTAYASSSDERFTQALAAERRCVDDTLRLFGVQLRSQIDEPAPESVEVFCPICVAHSMVIPLPTPQSLTSAQALFVRQRRLWAEKCQYVEWMSHFGPDGPPVRSDIEAVEEFTPVHINGLHGYGARRVYLNGGPSDGTVIVVNAPEARVAGPTTPPRSVWDESDPADSAYRTGRYTLQVGPRGYPLRLRGHPAEPVWLYNWQGWRD